MPWKSPPRGDQPCGVLASRRRDTNIEREALRPNRRAGGFDPLRFVPPGKKFIVLGLITTKTGALEDRDAVKARIEAVAKLAEVVEIAADVSRA